MSFLLTFEVGPDGDEVRVHGDAAGLRALARRLEWLAQAAERGAYEHAHLLTEDWGGGELSNVPQETDGPGRLAHHVKLYAWPTSGGARDVRSEPPPA
jgi:hypothetical protein